MLFGWKGIKGDDFKAAVENGASDEEMVRWVNEHGERKSPEETTKWREEMLAANPYHDPEKRDWFVEQLKVYNLDPNKTTLFDWLDVDDRESYKKAAA